MGLELEQALKNSSENTAKRSAQPDFMSILMFDPDSELQDTAGLAPQLLELELHTNSARKKY